MTESISRELGKTGSALEERVLEAMRQVELGREEALAELAESRDSLKQAASEFSRRIEALADGADDDLTRLQERLGELNFLLSENRALGSVDTFFELRARIEEAAGRVIDDLERIESRQGPLCAEGTRVRRAWDLFVGRMSLVKAHLSLAVDSAAVEFDEERRRLVADLERLRAESGHPDAYRHLLDRLLGRYREFKSILGALVLHPDETKPRAGR